VGRSHPHSRRANLARDRGVPRRPDRQDVGGSGACVRNRSRVPDITAVVEKANGGIGLDLKKRYDNNSSNLVRRSDQWPFLQRGVPAMGFITGLHPDDHTQYDRPEEIR
jgi:hypothetical protein